MCKTDSEPLHRHSKIDAITALPYYMNEIENLGLPGFSFAYHPYLSYHIVLIHIGVSIPYILTKKGDFNNET